MYGDLRAKGRYHIIGKFLCYEFVAKCLKTPVNIMCHHLQHPSLDHASIVGHHKKRRRLLDLKNKFKPQEKIFWWLCLKMLLMKMYVCY